VKRSEAIVGRSVEIYRKTQEGTRVEEILIAQKSVKQAEESVELARVRNSFATLRAPVAGIVTVKQAELGEVVGAGTPVVTVADLEHVWLRTYLPETDLGKVRFGQEVSVRTDTYPGKVYKGRISFISAVAEFTTKSVETHKERVTLVYRIKIDLENQNQELKPGMPADAVIEVDKS
jgi:HlyD family secretion protein